MKRFDMKGVSPVIATILLIALTVAAVGIVAVILTSLSPAGIGKNVILTLKKVENNSADPLYPEMKVILTNWGPDDIISGDLSIEFSVNYGGGWERGFASALPDTGSNPVTPISWVTGNAPDLDGAGMWPWKVGSGAEIAIILRGTDTRDIQWVSLVIKDANAGTVFFTESNLPLPT